MVLDAPLRLVAGGLDGEIDGAVDQADAGTPGAVIAAYEAGLVTPEHPKPE